MLPYVVHQGDTLSGVAQSFGVSLPALEAANPHITNPNLIFPGQVILIPVDPPAPGTYVVQSGDTMSGIAEKFGVSLSALEAANPQVSDPNLILPGQVLTIPGANPVSFFDYWVAHDCSMQLSEDGTGTLILGDGALNTDKWAVTWTKNPSDSITITLASLLGRSGPGMGNVGDQYIATIQPDAAGNQLLYMHRVGTEGQVITFATGAELSTPGSPSGA
jgi:spore coat assembly protein SafA